MQFVLQIGPKLDFPFRCSAIFYLAALFQVIEGILIKATSCYPVYCQ